MAYCAIVLSTGELYHHGILGQKWGQRNGPPYPLGASDHSAREKKAGWATSLKKGRAERKKIEKTRTKEMDENLKSYKNDKKRIKEEAKVKAKDAKVRYMEKEIDSAKKYRENYKKSVQNTKADVKSAYREALNSAKSNGQSLKEKLNDPDFKAKVAKTAKIGAAVAVTGLAIYGGYKLYQSGKLSAGRAAERNAIRLMREGVLSEFIPGSMTTNTRGSTAGMRVSMVRNAHDSYSSSAKQVYDDMSDAVNRGYTSALSIFDNFTNPKYDQGLLNLISDQINTSLPLSVPANSTGNTGNRLISSGEDFLRNRH